MNTNTNWKRVRDDLISTAKTIANLIEEYPESNAFICLDLGAYDKQETLDIFREFFEIDVIDIPETQTFNTKIYSRRDDVSWEESNRFSNQVRLMALATLIEYANMMIDESK